LGEPISLYNPFHQVEEMQPTGFQKKVNMVNEMTEAGLQMEYVYGMAGGRNNVKYVQGDRILFAAAKVLVLMQTNQNTQGSYFKKLYFYL
jgi:hypothetical protein